MQNQIRGTAFFLLASLYTFQVHAQDISEEPVIICAAEAYSLDGLIAALEKNGTKIPAEMSDTIRNWSDALANVAVSDPSDSERGMALYNLSSSRKAELFSEANQGDLQSVVDGRIALIQQCIADHVP